MNPVNLDFIFAVSTGIEPVPQAWQACTATTTPTNRWTVPGTRIELVLSAWKAACLPLATNRTFCWFFSHGEPANSPERNVGIEPLPQLGRLVHQSEMLHLAYLCRERDSNPWLKGYEPDLLPLQSPRYFESNRLFSDTYRSRQEYSCQYRCFCVHGRIRTFNQLLNKQLLYRWATRTLSWTPGQIRTVNFGVRTTNFLPLNYRCICSPCVNRTHIFQFVAEDPIHWTKGPVMISVLLRRLNVFCFISIFL